MLWKTHIRISNEVLRRLGITLPDDVYAKFKEGVLAPDKLKDYPHHYGKSDTIATNLMYARQFYLKDNLPDTFYWLGTAFHYIHDSYTSVISYNSPNNQIWHQNYEQSIEDSEFVYDLENTIQYFFMDNFAQLNRYINVANILSKKLEGKNDTILAATLEGRCPSAQTGKAKVDLNLALKASCVVAESVLSNKTNTQLDIALRQTLTHHESLLKNAELSSSEKIIEKANRVKNLKSKKTTKTGIFPKIKNGFLSLRIKISEFQLKSDFNKYTQKRHLLTVLNVYKQATNEIVNPHIGWYNYSIPELNLNIVEAELIPVQEVSKIFTINDDTLANLANAGKLNFHAVGKHYLVRRKELKQLAVH
jgi:excisionase family DNA binding protein